MKKPRVFFPPTGGGRDVVLKLKNYPSYPGNFQGVDFVDRYESVNDSRTAEGNGLGLAIAKSYTELCGGQLEIVVDGDLFKARLRFPAYQP